MKQHIKFEPFGNIIFISFVAIFTILHSGKAYGEKINSIVAIVNEEIITSFDVLRRTAAALQEAGGTLNDPESKKKRVEFYNQAIEELINREVLVQTAQLAMLNDEIKMDEIEKDLDNFIKGAAEEVGSLSKFYEIVTEQGLDPLEKKRELRDDLMIEKILKENVYRKISIRPKETKDYYNNHIDEFHKEEQISFRQILITFSEHSNRGAARQQAESLMNRLMQSEDFSALARQYSHGPHAVRGGLWTFEEVHDIRKDLLAIIFTLQNGELSEIIESSIGYHIIKCEENIAESYSPFKDVQEEIYQKLFREKFNEERKNYLAKLKKDFFIEKY